MIKRYKALLSVLLVVLTVFAVITVTGVVDINKMIKENSDPTGENIPENTYEDIFSTFTSAGLPLFSTDVENVFYTMDKKGSVSFYKSANGKIETLSETGNFEVSVPCSGQTLPVTIHYLEIEDKTIGYGLFTNEEHPDVLLYDYAFFKVANQFESYDGYSDLILLADVEKDRFYKEDKVYSESFYLYSTHKTKNFLNEDQRIVDLNARLRTDYKMFTDGILHQTDDEIMFFSSRFYNDYEYSKQVDIFLSGGWGENVDNNRYIKNVASLHLWRTDDGTFYFEEEELISAENSEQTVPGFALKCYDGKEDKVISTFEGKISDDYIIKGDYIFNKKTGEVKNVISGESFKIDYEQFKTTFHADMFTISENGKYVIVRGKNNLNKPSVGVMDVQNNKIYCYTDNVFGYVASMNALNDGTAVLSLAAGENSETYYQLVCKTGETVSEVPSSEAE